MTISALSFAESGDDTLADTARDRLWMHFTRHSVYEQGTGHVPIIVRGEGARIWDDQGRSYLDGLAGLFTVQVGHGRKEIAEAMAKQAEQLAFFPLWSYAHPTAIELADRLADLAPTDINRTFFTSGGGEAVESAWKLAKQYFKLTGKPTKHKVISRNIAYHGTPQGALSITGIPGAKIPFEPLVPGGIKAETRQALENIRTVLERHGSSLDRVIKCTAMLADMQEWAAMNEVYVTFFPKHLPARSAFGTTGLAFNARMELECIATVGT